MDPPRRMTCYGWNTGTMKHERWSMNDKGWLDDWMIGWIGIGTTNDKWWTIPVRWIFSRNTKRMNWELRLRVCWGFSALMKKPSTRRIYWKKLKPETFFFCLFSSDYCQLSSVCWQLLRKQPALPIRIIKFITSCGMNQDVISKTTDINKNE